MQLCVAGFQASTTSGAMPGHRPTGLVITGHIDIILSVKHSNASCVGRMVPKYTGTNHTCPTGARGMRAHIVGSLGSLLPSVLDARRKIKFKTLNQTQTSPLTNILMNQSGLGSVPGRRKLTVRGAIDTDRLREMAAAVPVLIYMRPPEAVRPRANLRPRGRR